jgi:hypothetical protein
MYLILRAELLCCSIIVAPEVYFRTIDYLVQVHQIAGSTVSSAIQTV